MKRAQHIIFAALQLVDFVTTAVGLRFGATEGNPLVVALMGAVGIYFALLLLKGTAVAASLLIPERVLRVLNVVFAVAMAWNTYKMALHLRG